MKTSYKCILTPAIVVVWYLSGKAKCLASMFTQIMASWWPPLSTKRINVYTNYGFLATSKDKKNSLINQMVSGIIKNLHTIIPVWV